MLFSICISRLFNWILFLRLEIKCSNFGEEVLSVFPKIVLSNHHANYRRRQKIYLLISIPSSDFTENIFTLSVVLLLYVYFCMIDKISRMLLVIWNVQTDGSFWLSHYFSGPNKQRAKTFEIMVSLTFWYVLCFIVSSADERSNTKLIMSFNQ